MIVCKGYSEESNNKALHCTYNLVCQVLKIRREKYKDLELFCFVFLFAKVHTKLTNLISHSINGVVIFQPFYYIESILHTKIEFKCYESLILNP